MQKLAGLSFSSLVSRRNLLLSWTKSWGTAHWENRGGAGVSIGYGLPGRGKFLYILWTGLKQLSSMCNFAVELLHPLFWCFWHGSRDGHRDGLLQLPAWLHQESPKTLTPPCMLIRPVSAAGIRSSFSRTTAQTEDQPIFRNPLSSTHGDWTWPDSRALCRDTVIVGLRQHPLSHGLRNSIYGFFFHCSL